MLNETGHPLGQSRLIGKIIYLILIAHCILTIPSTRDCLSQVTQQWVARYNGLGNGSDDAYSLAVDGSGNVYITGLSDGGGFNYDYATIKYNSAGVQQWVARYNGPGNIDDYAYSIAVDGSGNVYVTGNSTGDYGTIKYNSLGVQQWVARYNGPGNSNDAARSLAVDGSGNVYVTGVSEGSGTNGDYATIKYNSSGVQQWVTRYNGPPGDGYDYAYSLAVDGSGNVYVTGSSIGSGGIDYATIKYNSAGVQQWVARYNGPGNSNDAARSLAVDGSGNVYVTGSSIGTSYPDYDFATIKYNSSGDSLWVARYNGPGNNDDEATSLAVDGSGNVYVTGLSVESGTDYDYATLKYNSSGIQQWVARYNGPGNVDDYAYSIAVDGSGNVYVTGNSTGDYGTIKYNSSGVQQWVARYNGPGNNLDGARSLALDGSGYVYVTGFSRSGSKNETEDYATIKYSQLLGIKPVSNEIPDQYSLSQNYANPFNPMTKIRFALPKSSFATVVVYDILGREVSTLVNEQLEAGTYEVDWNASNYPSGVYYYRLIAGDPSAGSGQVFTETKKMILIK